MRNILYIHGFEGLISTTLCYVIIPLILSSVRDTHQILIMKLIFHDLMHCILEDYIHDVLEIHIECISCKKFDTNKY